MTEINNYRKVLLDASALIALIGKEEGWEKVTPLIPKAVMSAVNVTEVAQYFIGKKGVPRKEIEIIIAKLLQETVPYNGEQIFSTAELVIETKKYGLSLGDRACISLGLKTGYPVYTTDRAWGNLKIDNLKVILIR